jgi:hypothetical protein
MVVVEELESVIAPDAVDNAEHFLAGVAVGIAIASFFVS